MYKFVAKEKNMLAQLQTSTWAVNYEAHARGLLFLCKWFPYLMEAGMGLFFHVGLKLGDLKVQLYESSP